MNETDRRKRRRERQQTAKQDRIPPHNLETEAAIIGMMLNEPKMCVGLYAEKVKTPKAFYSLPHREMYEILADMWNRSETIDMVSFVKRLKEKDGLEAVGGAAYISQLVNDCPPSTNIEYHLDELKIYHRARMLIFTFQEGIGAIYEIGPAADRLKESLETVEESLTQARLLQADNTEKPIAEIMTDTMALVENYRRGGPQVEGVLTGWHYLNKMLCGLRPKEMLVVAARPGMGKTSLAMNWAEYAAIERGHHVMLFSMEMAYRELGGRFLYGRAKRNYQMFRTGMMPTEDVEHLDKAAEALSASKMWVDDNMSVSIGDLKAKVRRMVSLHQVDFVIIDYLQLLTGVRGKRYGNRAEEVADISRNLKILAKETNVSLLVLSQMNRESERNVSHVPKLSDLRESGAIEQDADAVAFLHRPKLKPKQLEQFRSDMDWDPENPPGWSEKVFRTDVRIEKNRNGPTGQAQFVYFAKYMVFEPYKRGTGIEPIKLYPREGNIELFDDDSEQDETQQSELDV